MARLTKPYVKKLRDLAEAKADPYAYVPTAVQVLDDVLRGWTLYEDWTVEDLFGHLRRHHVSDEEAELLGGVRVPRPPRGPRMVSDGDLADAQIDFADEIGTSVAWGLRDEVPREDVLGQLRKYARAFDGLPKAIKRLWDRLVKKVVVMDHGCSEDARWDAGGRLLLCLKPGKLRVPVLRDRLIHELGHGLEEAQSESVLERARLYGHPPFVSSYAGKNLWEDFAETYLHYVREPRRLRECCPEKYEDMEARVKTAGRRRALPTERRVSTVGTDERFNPSRELRRATRAIIRAAVREEDESETRGDPRPVVAVDFDGTIAENDVEYPDMGEPRPGAREALRGLHELGFRVRVYTCRLAGHSVWDGVYEQQREALAEYMDRHGLYYDDFVLPVEGKPFADAYVDDKAVSCDDWDGAVTVLRRMMDAHRRLMGRVFRATAMTDEERVRREKKVESLRALSENIRALRTSTTKALQSADRRERYVAAVVGIIDRTGATVGNEASAADGHHGVTNLCREHVEVDGDRVTRRYVGKSGVEQEKSFTDARIARVVAEAIARAGDDGRLFVTDSGKITSKQVNRYLSDFGVTAKDLRAYAANHLMIDTLGNRSVPSDESERQKNWREVAKSVAEAIGHQSATLRRHYLLPDLEQQYVGEGRIPSLDG